MIRLVGPLFSFAIPKASKSGGVLSTTRLDGISVALNLTPEPQSVDKPSLFGPSISLITNRKSLTGTGVIPSASRKVNLILQLLFGYVPVVLRVYRILSA